MDGEGSAPVSSANLGRWHCKRRSPGRHVWSLGRSSRSWPAPTGQGNWPQPLYPRSVGRRGRPSPISPTSSAIPAIGQVAVRAGIQRGICDEATVLTSATCIWWASPMFSPAWDRAAANCSQSLGSSHRLRRSNLEPGRRFANHLDFQAKFDAWCETMNRRVHRTIRAVLVDRLLEEFGRMRPPPDRLPDTDRRAGVRVA